MHTSIGDLPVSEMTTSIPPHRARAAELAARIRVITLAG
jgi:hypothetical protein